MIPVVALVGRKQVGKSSLFNCLTCTRDALVEHLNDLGLTRDRRYGFFKWKDCRAFIIDTGGVEIVRKGMDVSIFNQSMYAVSEANLLLFVVDGKVGLLPDDYNIVHYLYKFCKSMFVVVNKVDNINLENIQFEFYSLGVKKIIFVSAIYGYGINFLLKEIFTEFYNKKLLVKNRNDNEDFELEVFSKSPSYFLKDNKRSDLIVLAVIGAPNVGKSTFINYVLGTSRMVVSNVPGTTRDSVCTSVIYDNYKYILVDTAGMRKKNKISSIEEGLSIINTLKIIKNVTVTLLLIDASNGITNYDLFLLNHILYIGKSLVIGVNKWDLLSYDLQKQFKMVCDVRIRFVPFVNRYFISSLSGYGIQNLLKSIIEMHNSCLKSVKTSLLTKIMRLAIYEHSPPRLYGKQVKLKYAHMGGYFPFTIVIHGDYVTKLPDNYRRYLMNYFSRSLKMIGKSVCIRFKENI